MRIRFKRDICGFNFDKVTPHCQRKMLYGNRENLSTYIASVINTRFSHAIVYTIALSATKRYFVKSIRNISSLSHLPSFARE